ncbi:hypothetical protein EMCG_01279 [[Emmonsia] crescens]|uniref:Uncharacterized protein n=1 Tax=[Emmonsia] crescens TaxID=73230 RepID=A0A0G2JA97_9EURO|nr:hypothetical protein EMCG_01279 [Emmonsia crescens UAMH 3008]
MISAVALLLLPALALARPVESPRPDKLQIVDTARSGKRLSPKYPGLTDDLLKIVTFGFDKLQAYIGPRSSQANRAQDCQLPL